MFKPDMLPDQTSEKTVMERVGVRLLLFSTILFRYVALAIRQANNKLSSTKRRIQESISLLNYQLGCCRNIFVSFFKLKRYNGFIDMD
ncbi:MAG: hypothetical protein A4E53_01456 [Pelotomaculum sp. PtaB.Bin104]|nr:MAG: hypothetical protein A4E53_01456 [Pelotomaculum sp. PtaB.Bin104]